MITKITETQTIKSCKSDNYNFIFDKINGTFLRWGKTFQDDPSIAPSPEILDFEVTTKCNYGCDFCYKSNTKTGKNLSFSDFKIIFDKLPKSITQIAFGADADCTSNPDLFKMMNYARRNGVIPNITIVTVKEKDAEKLVDVVGAVAVSRHKDGKKCYQTIKLLSDLGLKQINIHILVSKETEYMIYETFSDYLNGDIPGLNAIVLLGLKKKGRGKGHHILTKKAYKKIIDYALDNNIPIGADSCSAPKLIDSVKGRNNEEKIKQLVDPCESTRFSIYIDVNGAAYPCSFTPGIEGWEEGINMFNVTDFFKDVWNNKKIIKFRQDLLKSKDKNDCETCILYDI